MSELVRLTALCSLGCVAIFLWHQDANQISYNYRHGVELPVSTYNHVILPRENKPLEEAWGQPLESNHNRSSSYAIAPQAAVPADHYFPPSFSPPKVLEEAGVVVAEGTNEDGGGDSKQARRKLPTLSHMAKHGKQVKKGGGGGVGSGRGRKKGGPAGVERKGAGDEDVGNEDSENMDQATDQATTSSPAAKKPPSSSPRFEGTCPDNKPVSGQLKVVDDLTKETAHVELLSDSHVPQRFSKPPQPIMSSQAKLAALCPKYGWRFCPKPNRGSEDVNWYTCEARQFVGKVHCAYIDNQGTIPGMVYDSERTYPVHGCHPHKLNFQPQPLKKVVKLKSVAHNLAVYPTGFAHVMAQLPRLIHLVQTIPEDVPILLAPSSARDGFVKLLHDLGVLDKKRILDWKADTVYHADTVYYAGEMGRGKGTQQEWNTLKKEFCSWALVMPRKRLQALFSSLHAAPRNESSVSSSSSLLGVAGGVQAPARAPARVLVVHRKDASGGRRMCKNHASMLAALKAEYEPNAVFTEFVGANHNMRESIELFASSDVVVAPHGAALGFLAFMKPGAACVEIGYKDLKGMKFPAPYYMALALSVDVAYFLSMAEGGYGTQLTADVDDVVAVTKKALDFVNTPGARFPNLAA